MSGGHGHGAGHDEAHGHGGGAPAGAASHGPLEFPPVPDPRMITPAREDYQQPWPGSLLLWPLLWLVVAGLFYAVAHRDPPPTEGHEGAAEHGAHE